MAENTKGQEPNKNRDEGKLSGGMTGNVTHQKGSGDPGSRSTMDEKSSTTGRRDKGTGLATKDGTTGSDFDGQVSE